MTTGAPSEAPVRAVSGLDVDKHSSAPVGGSLAGQPRRDGVLRLPASRLRPDAVPKMNLGPPVPEGDRRTDRRRLVMPAARPAQRQPLLHASGAVPVRLVRDHLLPASPSVAARMRRSVPALAVVAMVELPLSSDRDQLAATTAGRLPARNDRSQMSTDGTMGATVPRARIGRLLPRPMRHDQTRPLSRLCDTGKPLPSGGVRFRAGVAARLWLKKDARLQVLCAG